MAWQRVPNDFEPGDPIESTQSESQPPGNWQRAPEEIGAFGTPSWEDAFKKSIESDREKPWWESAAEGFNRPFEKLGHGVMDPLIGLFSDDWEQKARQSNLREDYELDKSREQNPWSTGIGEVAGNIGLAIPAMASGTGLVGALAKDAPKWLTRIAGGGLGLGALGGASQPGDDETRLANALIEGGIGLAGGAAGELISPAFQAARQIPETIESSLAQFGVKAPVASSLAKRISKPEMQAGREGYAAARELGINLTPAEATGSQQMAKLEASLGSTLKNERQILDFKKGQKEAQKRAVGDLFHGIAPKGEVSHAVKGRKLAKAIIKEKESALVAKARPFYEKADPLSVGEEKFSELMLDSNINRAYKDVVTDDLYKTRIKGFRPDSIKVLDQAKKNLYGKEAAYSRAGEKDAASIIKDARRQLTKSLDDISPDYKKARGIYSDESPALDLLREGDMGKIANMKDTTLQNFTKNLFDSKETDKVVLNRIRDEMYAKEPETWNALVRNEMERKMSQSAHLPKTDNYGSTFYDLVLSKDMDMFKRALKNSPKELRRLELMEKAFKNLINSRTIKTVAGQAETSMSKARSSSQWYVNLAKKLTGGKYDKAAIDIITNPDWDIKLSKALAKQGIEAQNKGILQLLEDASKGTTKALTAEVGQLSTSID